MRSAWEIKAAEELRAVLRAADMSYSELARALGIKGGNGGTILTKRIYRGTFTLAFFLECKEVAEAHAARLEKSLERARRITN